MPRCKTCREKFVAEDFNQKNCKENQECIDAEIALKQEAQQKRIDKAKDKAATQPQGIIEVKRDLSPEEVREFKKAWEKANKGRGKLILINKKTPKTVSIKKSRPKPMSKKQVKIESDYHKMLKVYDANTEPKCTGCNRYQGGDIALSHSHVISRADCKRYGRPDLISDPRNIRLHCLDLGEHVGCHRRHEQRDNTLLDWEDKLAFVYEICVEIENDELVNKLLLK